jgi:hypothetical protein
MAAKIHTFKLAHLRYQSYDDFRWCKDIVRCNPLFHGAPRFDSVIAEDAADFRYGRLELLFRVETRSGVAHELALVTTYKSNAWKPRTVWDGCTVIEPGKAKIVSLAYLARAALVVDTNLLNPTGERFYLDDLIDNDMFLRLGN